MASSFQIKSTVEKCKQPSNLHNQLNDSKESIFTMYHLLVFILKPNYDSAIAITHDVSFWQIKAREKEKDSLTKKVELQTMNSVFYLRNWNIA